MNPIIFPLKLKMHGPAVTDLQDAVQLCLERGVILANDPSGQKEMLAALKPEQATQTYGDTTVKLVSIFQQEQKLKTTGAVDEPTANAFNALLKGWGMFDQRPVPPGKTYLVDGKVASRVSAGVRGLSVVIVDKGIGGDVQLAKTVTDDHGAYQGTFSDSAIRNRGKALPDLQARVFAGATFLGASDVHYNASQHETLNVLLPDTAVANLQSEYETLTSTLAGQLKGNLRDLKETDGQADITYLANKTGWDARAVALAALADQFTAQTASAPGAPTIPQSYFYALFRAGLPANEDTLYHTDSKTLEGVWKQAAEQGVIPKTTDKEISKLTIQFQELSAEKLLAGPALIGISSLKEMLAVSRLTNAQQVKLSQIYAANRSDMPAFWKAVGDDSTFGNTPDLRVQTVNRLQVVGKLAFLTINNAPLIEKVQSKIGGKGLSDPLQLAQMGYYRSAAWETLLTEGIAIPNEIPGDTPATRQKNYADYLAAQVQLSYPTASVAQMVKNKELPLTGAADGVSDQVHAFLTGQQSNFEIGVEPVERYIARKSLQVPAETVTQVKRLQRVYQITPTDQAMIGLMTRGIDAAYHVVSYDRDTFIQTFAADLGGEDQATLTYERSIQLHSSVLNVALSYLHARTAPAIGVHSPPSVIDPVPANPGDIIAYATLESLFGSMDFCSCDHCRSILSPAAYLVDLLHFLDQPNPPTGTENPQMVLLDRRPDIQHLPLTCENTNTALPYIDVVNETLEYYVANQLTLLERKDQHGNKLNLGEYLGHDTDGTSSEDLLASPQFVVDAAYTTLGNERFPPPLPFHKPLENLRRYFNKFEVPLPLAMERLRTTDDLERDANPYGWRDILMEEIGLSRAEYEILTDSPSDVPLWQMYGFPSGMADADVVAQLSNAEEFSRRVAITYEELLSILRCRFVNPNSDLIPKLQRLGVSFATLKDLKDDKIDGATFASLLPTGSAAPDPAEYGGDIVAWVKNNDNYARIMGLLTLAIPASTWAASKPYESGDCVVPKAPAAQSSLYYECTTAGTSAATEPAWPTSPGSTYNDNTVVWTCRDVGSCESFDNLAFRYSDPSKRDENIGAVEFVRLLRFIRLRKKLGWTIGQTDAAICALYRSDLTALGASDIDDVAKLDSGFLTLLPRLGIVRRVMKSLNLTVRRDLLALLACFTPIGVHDGAEWVPDTEGGLQLQIIPSLYRQMFLSPTLLRQDAVFADNGYGEFLADATKRIADHVEAVRSAFNLTSEELSQIAAALQFTILLEAPYIHDQPTLSRALLEAAPGIGYDEMSHRLSYPGTLTATSRDALKAVAGVSQQFKDAVDALFAANSTLTPLALSNISAIFRRGWLARKLKLSVPELLTLIGLVGLDPFAAPEPTNPAVVRLIDFVQTLRERSLKSAVALYLIWNRDLSGKSVPKADTLAAFARTLRTGLAAVENEFTVTDDADGAIAQAQLAKVYGAATAAFFFGLLNDTLTVEIAFNDPDSTMASGAARQAIENAAGETEAGAPRIAYDDFRKRLSFSGVLEATTRDAIKTAAGDGADAFKTAVDNLYGENLAMIQPFFDRYPELQSPYDAYVGDTTDSVAEKHRNLLQAILPELIEGRKRQQALQSVSAAVGSELTFAQTLLDSAPAPFPLHAVGQADNPALNDLLALEIPGLSVQFFANDAATGTPMTERIDANLAYAPATNGVGNPLPENTTTAGDPISGIWRGYLEAPEDGFFTLAVEADAGATVTLVLEGNVVNLAQNGGRWENGDPIELQAGSLSLIELKVEKVKDSVRVIWDWQPRGQGRAVIPGRYLYPASLFERYSGTYVRFLKAASIAKSLALTADELTFFATHVDYQIAGDGWLNALSVSGDPEPATAIALLRCFRALLDFARIKADISPSDESLLTVLKEPAAAAQDSDSLLFKITRWNPTSLNDVLSQFSGSVAGFGHFDLFRRVYDAFVLIRQMGISADALIRATTNEPTADTVQDLQAALRARFDAESWREVVRPINDEMRSLQRDALVAYILHQMGSHSESAHINTPEKLFEYFLMDVQMDPCTETSRIRHALSSVQLFIERCLMNLEPRVSPAAINATQWQWMKRYRVWEANRKVYLFPENWLEPELRDDQSPIFKETMSELLQGDITQDRAATALLNYLSKLEEVAKLEACGIYYVPSDQSSRTGEVAHVVARTAGANRKYYYRRYEYGYWTPWEQIKLDIEDNPVIPVVWNDRLFVFWLRILTKGPDSVQKPFTKTGSLTSLKTTDIKTDPPTVRVHAVLCWSEYYNGKWQATRTSDVAHPLKVGDFQSNAFDRSKLTLSVLFWPEGASHPQDALRVMVTYDGYGNSFFLHNAFSTPELREQQKEPHFARKRILDTATDSLKINYPNQNVSNPVLVNDINDNAIQPNHPLDGNPWDAPFFYEDARYVFYVTTAEEVVLVPQWSGVGIQVSVPQVIPNIPPLVFEPSKIVSGPIGPIIKQPGFGVTDPSPAARYVTEDAYIHQAIGTAGTVSYGGMEIGLDGGQITSIRTR